jgi:diguanylate cyclase (GGDEF)-like protein
MTGGEQGMYLLAWACMVLLMAAGLAALVNCRLFGNFQWRQLLSMRDAVFSADPGQRTLFLRFLVGMFNCVAGVLALNYGAAIGCVDETAARQLSVAALVASVGYGVAIRSGWNKRFKDSSLVEPQVMTATAFLAWGYLLGGPGRPVALMLLFVVLLFCLFKITSRQLVRCCVLAAVMFGAAFARIATSAASEPFLVEIQAVFFAVLIVVLMSMCLLSAHISSIRQRSLKRKRELAQAMIKIRELAIRDELTGLFNRRHMQDLLGNERSRAERLNYPWCIALLDLDHFKQVNDRHGHAVGDEVLRSAALLIKDGLRESDQVARWGGEEFLIMFPDTSCEEAEQVLMRIRRAMAQAMVSCTVPDLTSTFSAGVTAVEGDEALPRMIDRADQALYRAKAAGRNRTEQLASCDLAATHTHRA